MKGQNKVSREEALHIFDLLTKERNPPTYIVGKYLSLIRDGNFYSGGFCDWVNASCWFDKRMAFNLMRFYREAVRKKIPPDRLINCDVDLTKLIDMTNVLTPTNLDDWLKLAESLTTEKLRAKVKQAMLAKAA
jgi:hypothetical protein